MRRIGRGNQQNSRNQMRRVVRASEKMLQLTDRSRGRDTGHNTQETQNRKHKHREVTEREHNWRTGDERKGEKRWVGRRRQRRTPARSEERAIFLCCFIWSTSVALPLIVWGCSGHLHA